MQLAADTKSQNNSQTSKKGNLWKALQALRQHHWNQPLDVFYKKAILKNFSIFTGKHLCCSLF